MRRQPFTRRLGVASGHSLIAGRLEFLDRCRADDPID